MRNQAPRPIYLLVFTFIAISLTYQLVAITSITVGFFDLRHQVKEPFQTDFYVPVITAVSESARAAGLEKGDRLETIQGQPFSGRAQLQSMRWYAKPGETMQLVVRKASGEFRAVAIPLTGYDVRPSLAESVFVMLLQAVIPLLCLILGYWVALARPTDLNAWLILVMLTYPESFISVSTYNWWPDWLMLRLAWHLAVQVMAPAALLWLGLNFPQRGRLDRTLPWLKWLVLAFMSAALAGSLFTDYLVWYTPGSRDLARSIDDFATPIINSVVIFCIVVYCAALIDQFLAESSSDSRRRLNILFFGSAVGLGGTMFNWIVLPRFGLNPATLQWLGYTTAVTLLVFPFTLAYVVVVQRALDISILVRMGTRYVLARGSVTLIQITLLSLVTFRVLIPFFERQGDRRLYIAIPALLIGVIIRIYFVKRTPFDRLREYIDRRYFREAYNAEVVLSALVEEIRVINDPGPLLSAVSGRVAEVLHIPRMAILIRHGDGFRLEHIAGAPATREPNESDSLALAAASSTVRRLTTTNTPALLYRDRPEAWFLEATDDERRALDQLRAEVLLPLTGRNKLMGVMVLGPKLSEEPYSPTDLRLLASIGAQTGLGLEVNHLAQSLAHEAAGRQRIQREVEIAREVQQRLFPQQIPALPGIELAGHCRPALEVGGDYYDMLELEDGRLALAIGDVSGKGIGAALLMASLRASLRGMTDGSSHDLARMVRKLNRLVYEASTSNRYATFFFAIYDPKTRELSYVNGGHNAPMIIRAAGDAIAPLTNQPESLRLEATGPVVGLLKDMDFEQASVILRPGDLFIGYTDGISEAMTPEDEEWGEDRMLEAAQLVRLQPVQAILDHLFLEADAFAAGAPQHDDMTLLVMKLTESGSA